MSTSISGTTFKAGANNPEHCIHLINTNDALSSLPDADKTLIIKLLELGETRQRDIGINELAKACKLTTSTLTVYSLRIKKSGLFHKYKAQTKTNKVGRRPVVYELVDLDTFVDAAAQTESDEPVQLTRHEIDNQDLQGDLFGGDSLPENYGQQSFYQPGRTYKAEQMSVFTFLAALRLGNSGKRAFGTHTTFISIGKERTLRVRVSAAEGQIMAGVLATKELIALASYAQYYYTHEQPDRTKPLPVDHSEFITRYLKKTNDGGTRDSTWENIRSWRHTDFEILSASPLVHELFGQDLMELEEFSFISRIRSLVVGKQKLKSSLKREKIEFIPLRYNVSLDPLFLERILDPSFSYMLSVEEEIMNINVPSRLAFYFWCRRAVKYVTKPTIEWTFEWLKGDLDREVTNQQFEQYMTAALGEPISANLYKVLSYRVRVKVFVDPDTGKEVPSKNTYFVWADKDEPFIKAYYSQSKTATVEA